MGSLKDKYFFPTILTVAWMGWIFFLSHQPGNPNVPPPFEGFDKVMHFIAYAVLAGFAAWSLTTHFKVTPMWRVWILALVFSSLYGVTDEFHQSFIPHRSVDVWDWVADTLGAAVGARVALWRLALL